ncbi:MAG: EamA family transporter [Streptosporangiaceae bacterium]
MASAAGVFALWRRPWRVIAHAGRPERRSLVGPGSALGIMNTCFYVALARLPLGTVGAIEFLGPILLAAAGVRTGRNLGALALAVGGVSLLVDVRLAGAPVGFVFAFANCALFMLYVVLGHRAAAQGGAAGIDRLGAAMLVATVAVTPIGIDQAAIAFTAPILFAAGVGVGVCSSVIPSACDQLAMARLPRSTFALLLALLPATATVIGVVVLAQLPTPAEAAGIGLVVAGVGLHRTRA